MTRGFWPLLNSSITSATSAWSESVRVLLSRISPRPPKIDIRTDHGLDQFIGMVLDDNAQTVLADLGAGSSKETWAWFEQMHDSVREEGIRFLAIGLVTNDSS